MGASDFIVFCSFAAILGFILIGATLLAAPLRRKMVVLANDLQGGSKPTDRLHRRVDFLLDTSASPMIALLLIVAVFVSMIDDVFLGTEEECHGFESDPRYQQLVVLYFGSVLLANPLSCVVLVPLMLVSAVVSGCAKGIRGVRLAEAQVERISHSRLARA